MTVIAVEAHNATCFWYIRPRGLYGAADLPCGALKLVEKRVRRKRRP